MKIYKSFTFSVFNSVTLLVFGFFVLFVLFIFTIATAKMSFIYAASIVITAQILYMLSSITQVKNTNNNLELQSLTKTLFVNDVNNLKTWWSYDYGISSPEIMDGGVGKANPIANKINCYVKFESSKGAAYIYEQIYLSDKFPNNHPYLANEQIDKSKMIKVWDIDNCLSKLDLAIG